MKKSLFMGVVAFFILITTLVGCSSSNDDSSSEIAMQYMTPVQLEEILKEGNDDYVVIDARQKADYDTSHVSGSYLADMDSAKEGNNEEGTANLKKALKEATGEETGKDGDKYVLLCYSGNSYARKATELLIEMGISEDDIYTLEGGYKAWTNEDLLTN